MTGLHDAVRLPQAFVLPPWRLILVAAVGGCLLLVVAVNRWAIPQDEGAYWQAATRLMAGQSVYDPTAFPGAPYVYFYPPPLAQVLAPVTLVVPVPLFTLAWTILLLGCLWYLAGGRPLVALALVAFVPVAVELWYRNIHLILAALAVIAIRRSAWAWVPAILIKVTPVLGVVFLLGARRYRDAAAVVAATAAIVAASIVLAPAAWLDFATVISLNFGTSAASLLPIPFQVRFGAAVAFAFAGGRLGGRRGEAMLIVALVIGNPTLTMTAFSMLAALVPLWRHAPAASAGTVTGPLTDRR